MFSRNLCLVVVLILFGFSVGAKEEIGVPFCKCVNATIDCADSVTLDGLIVSLLEIADECLNGCSDYCQASFYPLHAYHELCPGFGADAGELYHDLSLSCQVCDPGHLGSAIDRPECPPVDCSNFGDQGQLVALLTSAECVSNCSTNNTCMDAWTWLSAYHETCPEESLSLDLAKEYHDIEESCPPECAPPLTNVPPLGETDCGAMSMIMVDNHEHDEHEGHDHDEHDEHEGHDHDAHDEHDHDEHGGDKDGAPFCECVNATVDCADTATLDVLVSNLMDLSECNMNECSEECQALFYQFHAYHELCAGFWAEAGDLYHDLILSCKVCNVVHADTPMDRAECLPVNCSDFTDQQQLVDNLTSPTCASNCSAIDDCVDAWIKLSSYHETCNEDNLIDGFSRVYHIIEESCPPECARPTTGAPMGEIDCGAMPMMMGDNHDLDEHVEHGHDEHDGHAPDEHDEHEGHDDNDHHEHGGEKVGAPFCECVNATVDCADTATLDVLVSNLMDLSECNMNECSEECQMLFYQFHAYHELCAGFWAEAGDLYHDLELSCKVCNVIYEDTPVGRAECLPVNCSDFTDQQSLVDLLTSTTCTNICSSNDVCVDAWIRLSSYHETCNEDNLIDGFSRVYHIIEESCPLECARPTTGAPMGEIDCEAMSMMMVDDHKHDEHDHHDDHDDDHNHGNSSP